ncbi:MAG: Glu/Leu/Phe/Val dehydrogenase [Bacteroidia bacterium]|nr:Glu/Leu/Phe/Val dehydrogenase [Bacteroidia bacterium]
MVEVKNVIPVSDSKGQAVFGPVTELGHEQVLFCSDNETGLKAIIGVHNTTLGPALGGTRMWTYASDLDALKDVLRLSRGMSFKAAISGLNLGGGKAVILGDSRSMKSEAFMRRFGKFVNNLGGKYITAEDVGTSTQDMEWIRMETPHVTGIPVAMGGSGDPSPVTAYGTYLGMKASMQKLTGSDSLSGKKVIVQGVGNVGYYLCGHLKEEGADTYVFDIFEDKIAKVVADFGVNVISAEQVYTMHADIYAPCALGATVNQDTIPGLNVSIIAGAANNQLLNEVEDARRLQERGILYAPDFVINAGGLINVYTELEGYNRERAMAKATGIYDTTLKIYDYAAANQITTSEASIILAQKRIDEVGRLRLYK